MENLVLNIFCSMTLFKKNVNYGEISKKLILETFTSFSSFSYSSNSRGQTQCFLLREGGQKEPRKCFQGTFKALNTPMDKIAKILSQPTKYNVFCGTEASSIISSVIQYRITKNCDCHTLCSSLITIYYYIWKKIRMLFSYHNVMEMGLKLEERNFYTVNFMVRHI